MKKQNGNVQLALYAQPGATVRVEWSSQWPAASSDWNTLTRTNPTRLTTLLAPIPANAPMRFFRAVKE